MDSEQRLTNHPLFGACVHPDKNADVRYALVEAGVAELARILEEVAPASRERSLALTNLEQAGLWALCAIARDPRSSGTG